MKPMNMFQKDTLMVRIYTDRTEMGAAAAGDGAEILRGILKEQGNARVIFAAAPSQNELLHSLCHTEGIDWTKVTAFHMDEYIALDAAAPQGFGNFLRTRLFDRLPFAQVHYLDGNAESPEAECTRYGALLEEKPIDLIFMGIGENGHIAFNDPPVADFNDPDTVKVVELDPVCRMQQVHDGCFERLEDVPTHALTLTISALTKAMHHICVVPGASKAKAVKDTVCGPLGTACPASVLKRCTHATLYLEPQSALLLKGESEI